MRTFVSIILIQLAASAALAGGVEWLGVTYAEQSRRRDGTVETVVYAPETGSGLLRLQSVADKAPRRVLGALLAADPQLRVVRDQGLRCVLEKAGKEGTRKVLLVLGGEGEGQGTRIISYEEASPEGDALCEAWLARFLALPPGIEAGF